MIFFEGHPSISPSFCLETWTVLETCLPSSTEIANIMQREHNKILRHLTTGDTFKELIITFYSPRCITLVNPSHSVKFFTWYYFTN